MRYLRALAVSAFTVGAVFLGLVPLAQPAAAATVTTVSLPMTCVFGGGVPSSSQTTIVTVGAPKTKAAGTKYKVTFRTQAPDLNPVPFQVNDFSLTSTWTLLGPVQPSTAGPFTSPTVTVPNGGTIAFPTSHHLYKATGTHGAVISYRLDGISYTFKTTPGGSPVTATCTLDAGPAVIATTTVQ